MNNNLENRRKAMRYDRIVGFLLAEGVLTFEDYSKDDQGARDPALKALTQVTNQGANEATETLKKAGVPVDSIGLLASVEQAAKAFETVDRIHKTMSFYGFNYSSSVVQSVKDLCEKMQKQAENLETTEEPLFVEMVRDELAHDRISTQSTRGLLTSVELEMDAVIRAATQGTLGEVSKACIRLAALVQRFAEDGDSDLNGQREANKLSPFPGSSKGGETILMVSQERGTLKEIGKALSVHGGDHDVYETPKQILEGVKEFLLNEKRIVNDWQKLGEAMRDVGVITDKNVPLSSDVMQSGLRHLVEYRDQYLAAWKIVEETPYAGDTLSKKIRSIYIMLTDIDKNLVEAGFEGRGETPEGFVAAVRELVHLKKQYQEKHGKAKEILKGISAEIGLVTLAESVVERCRLAEQHAAKKSDLLYESESALRDIAAMLMKVDLFNPENPAEGDEVKLAVVRLIDQNKNLINLKRDAVEILTDSGFEPESSFDNTFLEAIHKAVSHKDSDTNEVLEEIAKQLTDSKNYLPQTGNIAKDVLAGVSNLIQLSRNYSEASTAIVKHNANKAATLPRFADNQLVSFFAIIGGRQNAVVVKRHETGVYELLSSEGATIMRFETDLEPRSMFATGDDVTFTYKEHRHAMVMDSCYSEWSQKWVYSILLANGDTMEVHESDLRKRVYATPARFEINAPVFTYGDPEPWFVGAREWNENFQTWEYKLSRREGEATLVTVDEGRLVADIGSRSKTEPLFEIGQRVRYNTHSDIWVISLRTWSIRQKTWLYNMDREYFPDDKCGNITEDSLQPVDKPEPRDYVGRNVKVLENAKELAIQNGISGRSWIAWLGSLQGTTQTVESVQLNDFGLFLLFTNQDVFLNSKYVQLVK